MHSFGFGMYLGETFDQAERKCYLYKYMCSVKLILLCPIIDINKLRGMILGFVKIGMLGICKTIR